MTATATAAPPALTYARLAWRYGLSAATLTSLNVTQRTALAAEAGVDLATCPWGEVLTRLGAMYAAALTPHAAAAPPQDLADAPKPWERAASPAKPAALEAQAAPTRPRTAPDPVQRALNNARNAPPAPPEPVEDAPQSREPADDGPEPHTALKNRPKRPVFEPQIGHKPAGWDTQAALGPLHGDPECDFCDQPAVAATFDTLRCADHPPQPGEWGAHLDHTPAPGSRCAPKRCLCGRHPSYRVPPALPARLDTPKEPR